MGTEQVREMCFGLSAVVLRAVNFLVMLCLPETNKFIIVFQFYNTMGCPLKKFLFSADLSNTYTIICLTLQVSYIRMTSQEDSIWRSGCRWNGIKFILKIDVNA